MRVNGQWLATCLVSLLVCSLTACNRGSGVKAAGEDEPLAVSQAERDFMTQAAQANLAEIDAARIALQKSDNIDVRDYANMIAHDHNSALVDLTDLMKPRDLPQPQTLAAQTLGDINRLNNLTGPEFDREFVNMMVGDHQKGVELFRDAQTSVEDPDVSTYVEKLTPKLEMHLDKAQLLQSKLFGAPQKR